MLKQCPFASRLRLHLCCSHDISLLLFQLPCLEMSDIAPTNDGPPSSAALIPPGESSLAQKPFDLVGMISRVSALHERNMLEHTKCGDS